MQHVKLLTSVLLCAWLSACGPSINQSNTRPFDEYAAWQRTTFATGDLYYASAGEPGRPLVVFVHGTPGSWSAFRAYLSDPRLLEQVHMVALDRPGFGKSSELGVFPDFRDQAQAVAELFPANQSGRKALVVGHSLGGSIGYRVAMDYAEQVGAVLAISSAIDPALSNPRWYNYAAGLIPVRWLLPADLTTSNHEMMPLAAQLTDVAQDLDKLHMPVTIVQGAHDSLVSHKNVSFAENRLVNAQLKVRHFPERGHFIVWEEHDAMVDEILELVKQLEPLPGPVVRQYEQNNNNQLSVGSQT